MGYEGQVLQDEGDTALDGGVSAGQEAADDVGAHQKPEPHVIPKG